MLNLKDFIIICGHYGCGKTNLSLNLALSYAKQGESVTLVDFDLVNPYFRSSDYRNLLQEAGIQVIAPGYAGTNLDLPSLTPEFNSIFEKEGRVILDVGGDDAGSTVLGRFYAPMQKKEYDMLYVVNQYRNLIATKEEAKELLLEIERVSRLKATGIVNNSHLKWETDSETILATRQYAKDIAQAVSLPLIFTTVPREILRQCSSDLIGAFEEGTLYPIDIHVRTSFEGETGYR